MNLFSRLALTVVLLSFSVILAGGVVRMTGSGMGCPDWPKCFGQYIPPTDISQLPPNYKLQFAVKGKEIADFDAFKTWVEYINRLLGAILGVAIVALTALSVRWRRYDISLPLLSIALLLVTGFVGWLGSVVVATDLEPVKITLHMLTSVIIVGLATTILHRARILQKSSGTETIPFKHTVPQFTLAIPQKLWGVIILALVLTLVQIVLGTQVREQIDIVAKQLEGRWRERWIEQLDTAFFVHRSISWFVVLVNAILIWYCVRLVGIRTEQSALELRRLLMGLATVIVVEISLGIIMAYFAVPKLAQPLHLLSAMVLFAIQFKSLLLLIEIRARVR